MYSIYIDDSGSSPEQKLAVASAIVFPAKSLLRFEEEWLQFLTLEGIPDFHSSECLARNPKSAFAGWDEQRVSKAFARAREITLKYSVTAFCIAIHKQDYMEVMPEDMRCRVGSFYTWAVSSVIGLAYDWSTTLDVPVEYIFDSADKSIEREIRELMEFCEIRAPGKFMNHFCFADRKTLPALQAVDLFAWTCYQAGRHIRFKHPIHPLAHESWALYRDAYKGRWATIQSLNREGIENWVQKTYLSDADIKVRDFNVEKKAARRSRKNSPRN